MTQNEKDLKKLAIKGHSTRGKEVIELLEMMGGINCYNLYGDENYACYIIENGEIKGCEYIFGDEPYVIYSLEEFLEKYPYKVGDIARLSRSNIAVIIKAMKWENDEIVYQLTCDCGWWSVDNLKPYREKIMEERQYDELRMPLDDDDKLATEVTIMGKRILPPDGYLVGKITQTDNGMLVEYVEKKPVYPKTYEECCECLSLGKDGKLYTKGYKASLIQNFQKLLICRDAYWKIAGEEMGLGKSWNPDFTNDDEERYGIYTLANKVERDFCGVGDVNMVLSFPTEEMRDVFYENFKDLIEQCKELL